MFASALAGAPPEVREYRELMRKASLGRVVSSAMRGERLSSGVEVEIRQAGGLADDCIPYELLDPGVQAAGIDAQLQHRVDAVSGGLSSVPTYQHTHHPAGVCARVVRQSVLGCRMLMAPTGDALIPVIDGGPNSRVQGEGRSSRFRRRDDQRFRPSAQALVARAWFFALEDEARVSGFEQALRMDLGQVHEPTRSTSRSSGWAMRRFAGCWRQAQTAESRI